MSRHTVHKARGLVGDGRFWTVCGEKTDAPTVAYVWPEVSCEHCLEEKLEGE